MFTGTLALLHRALRLDARLLRTHLFRVGFAGLVYVSLLFTWGRSATLGAPGLTLFETMAYLNLLLISLAGVSFFATAITEEKEEDTLGLLKLAGLNPLSILLGKSTSRLVGANLLLLVQFPFTLLAITLGGVTLLQVLAVYCSLAAYMVLLANVGLFFSIACRRGGAASISTLLFLILYFAAAPGLMAIRLGLLNGGVIAKSGWIDRHFEDAAELCRSGSIWNRIESITQTVFGDSPIGIQVLFSLLVAAMFFLLAWGTFHYFTRDARGSASPKVDLVSQLVGLGRKHRARPGRRPLAWKEFHFVAGGMPVQIVKFLIYGAMTGLVFWAAERYYGYSLAQAGEFVAIMMLVVITLESSMYASVIFHDEWRDRTLPLLTMLPIRPSSIIHWKIAGCLPALIPALVWLIAGCVIWPQGLEEFAKVLFLPSRWFVVLVAALFLTLTMFFSMVVRWGALPLAIAVMALGVLVSGCCGSPVFSMMMAVNRETGFAEGGFLLVDIVILTLIVGLQFDVRRRFEIASSQ
jgi:hypothetical protein